MSADAHQFFYLLYVWVHVWAAALTQQPDSQNEFFKVIKHKEICSVEH